MTFKLEIVSPEKLFFSDENIKEVIAPSFEGEMGILKDHIAIISFLKPGIIKIYDSSNQENKFYVEDGILEFKKNNLTILTSKISDVNQLDKSEINKIISESEKELSDTSINDNRRYIVNQKIDTLKSLN